MGTRLATILGASALLGFTAISANASETRVANFVLACDGSNKTFHFNATNLGTAASRFIQGAEISLFDTSGTLQYLILRAAPSGSQPDDTRQLLTLGNRSTHESNQFTGFFSVANVNGTIAFTVDGACTAPGQIQGLVTISFFS